jgi:leucyl-tRNA synthetase
MFLGPFSEGGDYQDKGITGPYGFLHRLWESVVPKNGELPDTPPDPEVEQKLHQTIQQVSEQVPALQYNTAIAAMMEYLNVARSGGRQPSRAEVEPLVCLVAPFAPHIAEELWLRLGHEGGIFDGAHWPAFDPVKAEESSVEVAVQVNGRLRGTVSAAPGASEDQVVALAKAEPNVAKHLEGMQVRKIIHVPDRLLNFVVG